MPIKPPQGARPYSHTKTDVDLSKAQITRLLRDYGATGVAWLEDFDSGQVELRFGITEEDGSTASYKITPAAFREKHKSWDPKEGKSSTVTAPNWPRAMRLLYHWLKAKLESIAFGLTETREEFLAQRLVRDASGREATVGELVIPAIESGGGRLAIDPPRAAMRVDAEVVGRD